MTLTHDAAQKLLELADEHNWTIDYSGNSFEIHDGDGSSSWTFNDDGTFEADSVVTEEQNITNETLIDANFSSSQNIPENTLEALEYDDISKDERGEWTGTQFVPDKSGWYLFVAYAMPESGSDGDDRSIRLFNDSTSSSVRTRQFGSTDTFQRLGATFSAKLIAGDEYDIRFRNQNSSDSIRDADTGTHLLIRSQFREA